MKSKWRGFLFHRTIVLYHIGYQCIGSLIDERNGEFGMIYRVIYYTLGDTSQPPKGTEENQELAYFTDPEVCSATVAILEEMKRNNKYYQLGYFVQEPENYNVSVNTETMTFTFRKNILTSLLSRDIPWESIQKYAINVSHR